MQTMTSEIPNHNAPATQLIEGLLQNALHCVMARNHDQAIALFNRVLQINPSHFAAIHNLASCLAMTSRTELALKTYQAALKSYPKSWEIVGGIANCYSQSGNFDEAVKFYKKALKIDPDNATLIYNLGLIYDYSPNSPTMQHLHKLYESGAYQDEARVSAGFTLARMYEKHGQYRHAFAYYEEVNRIQFTLSGYREKEAEFFGIFDAIESTFNAHYFAKFKNAGISDATPIFVLGMPRSGTSLVEQILASHPDVHGAGEVDILHPLLLQIAGIQEHYFLRPVPAMERPWFEHIAKLYLFRLRESCTAGNPRIVDKTPNNFLLIGLIKVLFPRATIINCVRDPMDNCWSMLRQHFSGNHPYCYDQVAVAKAYRRYEKLMRHWHHVLPGEILDVRYEQLLEQPEATMQALLTHCGLPWDEKCLSFHTTKRIVNTASLSQVRKPLYKHSLRSWEPLALELTPMRTALGLM